MVRTDEPRQMVTSGGHAEDIAVLFRQLGGMPLPMAAHAIASAGVPVFPCVPGKKNPIVPSGFKLATDDLRQVDGWWRWQPQANIGIPTGEASGLVVIDVDLHGTNGYTAYARAVRAGLIPEPLVTVVTPTGGQHSYFPADPAHEQRSWAIGDVGVDCRGDGGYIVAPPSMVRLDGAHRAYRVEQTAVGSVQPVNAARLREFLKPRPPRRPVPPGRQVGRTDAARLGAWLARQATDRNIKLFWAACRLAEGNVPVTVALDALMLAAQEDFGEREITRTVCSAYRTVGAGGRGRDPSVGHRRSFGDGLVPRATESCASASRVL